MALAETTVTLGLRWRDLDMLGHVNQAVYHELLEEGRATLFAREAEDMEWVLARVELDYLAEVRLDHRTVEVRSRVVELGRRKIVVAQEVERAGEVAARGRSVLVCWDPEARGSRDMTPGERAALGG